MSSFSKDWLHENLKLLLLNQKGITQESLQYLVQIHELSELNDQIQGILNQHLSSLLKMTHIAKEDIHSFYETQSELISDKSQQSTVQLNTSVHDIQLRTQKLEQKVNQIVEYTNQISLFLPKIQDTLSNLSVEIKALQQSDKQQSNIEITNNSAEIQSAKTTKEQNKAKDNRGRKPKSNPNVSVVQNNQVSSSHSSDLTKAAEQQDNDTPIILSPNDGITITSQSSKLVTSGIADKLIQLEESSSNHTTQERKNYGETLTAEQLSLELIEDTE